MVLSLLLYASHWLFNSFSKTVVKNQENKNGQYNHIMIKLADVYFYKPPAKTVEIDYAVLYLEGSARPYPHGNIF